MHIYVYINVMYVFFSVRLLNDLDSGLLIAFLLLQLFLVLCSLWIGIVPLALSLVSLLQQWSWSNGIFSRPF